MSKGHTIEHPNDASNGAKTQQLNDSLGLSRSRFSDQKRTLNRLINDIRFTGAGRDVKLPRIAVIGNQSAGKSSLIEALSAIRVPRDQGTCTKCPLEILLENSSSPWECQISLRSESDDDHRLLGTNATANQIKFGAAIHDPSLVEIALRRAQLAVLNPSIDPIHFVDFNPASAKKDVPPLNSKRQLSFSTNVVVVKISSPTTTDLTFVDLPGIISSTSKSENSGDIALIKNLCVNYIKDDCLILLTITMRDDIDNQSAFALAKEYDPEGLRTIGVLTKPDLLQEREDDQWLKIIRGETDPLSFGYFMTKQPNQVELESDSDFAEYRAAEKSFFLVKEPWASLDESLRRRLGTENLTTFLSEKLSDYIATKIPGMRSAINTMHQATLLQISRLPSPPSAEPVIQLLRICTAFSTDFEGFGVGSTAGHEKLVQELTRLANKFRLDILATVPIFIPWTDEQIKKDPLKKNYREPKAISETEGDVSVDSAEPTRMVQNLDNMRRQIIASTTRELYGNSPYSVLSKIILTSLEPWSDLVEGFLEAVKGPVFDLGNEIVKQHFGQFSNSGLNALARECVTKELENLFIESAKNLQWLLSLESVPYTQNNHYLSETESKLVATYTKTRQSFNYHCYPTASAKACGALAEMSLPSKMEDLARMLPPDEYAQEILMMAKAGAYFRVAYKRIIDNVPRGIDTDVIRKVGKGSVESLMISFKVTGDHDAMSNARNLLSESPSDARLRDDFVHKSERLTAAKKALAEFGFSR